MAEEEISIEAWNRYLKTGEEPGPPALHAAADQLRTLASKVAAHLIETQALVRKLDADGHDEQARLIGMLAVQKLKEFSHVELQAIVVQLSTFAVGFLCEAWGGDWDKVMRAICEEGVPLLPGGTIPTDNPESVHELNKLLEEPSK